MTGTYSGAFTDPNGSVYQGTYSTLTGILASGQNINTLVFDAISNTSGAGTGGMLNFAAVVPESSTFPLMVIGLAMPLGVWLARSRRSKVYIA